MIINSVHHNKHQTCSQPHYSTTCLPWLSSLLCCVHHESAATSKEESCVHTGETTFVYMLGHLMPLQVMVVHPLLMQHAQEAGEQCCSHWPNQCLEYWRTCTHWPCLLCQPIVSHVWNYLDKLGHAPRLLSFIFHKVCAIVCLLIYDTLRIFF